MAISNEIKVTTEILWKGALYFALIDVVFISVLTRLVKPDYLFRMKWNFGYSQWNTGKTSYVTGCQSCSSCNYCII